MLFGGLTFFGIRVAGNDDCFRSIEDVKKEEEESAKNEPVVEETEIESVAEPITTVVESVTEGDPVTINEPKKNEVRLTANFNYKPLLAKYDVEAVESSVIQYHEAVLSVTDEIMDILQEYENEQNETIRKQCFERAAENYFRASGIEH